MFEDTKHVAFAGRPLLETCIRTCAYIYICFNYFNSLIPCDVAMLPQSAMDSKLSCIMLSVIRIHLE